MEDDRISTISSCVCCQNDVLYELWLTGDVVARRADHLTDAERTVLSKCALCGGEQKAGGMSICRLSALQLVW